METQEVGEMNMEVTQAKRADDDGSTEASPLATNGGEHLIKSQQTLGEEMSRAGCKFLGDTVTLPDWYKFTERDPFQKITKIPMQAEHQLDQSSIHVLHMAHHPDPFGILGIKRVRETNQVIVRVWMNAKAVKLRPRERSGTIADAPIQLQKSADWLFEVMLEVEPIDDNEISFDIKYDLDIHYEWSETFMAGHDPYNFGLCLSDYDLKNFRSGHCWHVDNIMGSHIVDMDGVRGVRFSVWAPNARYISVVGDFNDWDGRSHPMRRRHEYGVWELFLPCAQVNQKYGYKIHTNSGTDMVKIDPFAQQFENPPKYASIISPCDDPFKPVSERFQWSDSAWLADRAKSATVDGPANVDRRPMSIYEVHLPSWMRGDNNTYLSYRDLADPLVKYIKKMNFTHVEFMPLAHHPFEGSWGYQISGTYAVYSRLGCPDDLKFLIDELHKNGIGVFMDLVLAHFCKDDWGLARFDGVPLFEYSDPREGEQYTWGTYIFNFARSEVRSYLLGAAYHWIRRYHIDGLRIDAVSAMIYKNYCRKDGEWIPNEYGGDANLQAISLLQEMNWVVHKNHPGVYMVAEESTSWRGVTDKENGLGFDAKWDLGWMNDMLSYTTTPRDLRSSKHSKLTFRGLYMTHEKWVLPLSHDEVVSGKGSLVDKMGYSDVPFGERVKTLRAVIGLQASIPGRPLIFMGSEFAQGREWSEARSLDWHEAEEDLRSRCSICVADIMKLYKTELALHAGDGEAWNFKWVCADNANDNLIAFIRSFGEWYNDVVVVVNFNESKQYRFPIAVPHGGDWVVLLNTDDWKYGGGMHGRGMGDREPTTQGGVLGWPYCLWLDIPGNSCLMLKPHRK